MIYEKSKSNWTITFHIGWYWKIEFSNLIGYYTIDVYKYNFNTQLEWKGKVLKMM